MRIERINTRLVATPLSQPIRTAIHRFDQVQHVVVELATDEGLGGTGLLFAQSASQGRLFQAAIANFESLVIGEDPLMTGAIWQKLWKAMNFIGNSGVSIFALSAIDTALWDIVGKAAGQPVRRLLGECAESMPVYASHGLWLGTPLDELVREAQGYAEQGFKFIKIRVGSPRLEDDIARVKAVREAVGPEVRLLTDANQGWDAPTTIRFGRTLEAAGIYLYWLEEPVPYYDLASSAAIAAALDIPLATGETEYTYLGFTRLAQEKAADVWMPDLQRIGGITGWQKIARLGEAFNTPVSPHLFPEISLHLALSSPNCQIMEYVNWWEPLLTEESRPRLVDGRLYPNDLPGLGIEVVATG